MLPVSVVVAAALVVVIVDYFLSVCVLFRLRSDTWYVRIHPFRLKILGLLYVLLSHIENTGMFYVRPCLFIDTSFVYCSSTICLHISVVCS